MTLRDEKRDTGLLLEEMYDKQLNKPGYNVL